MPQKKFISYDLSENAWINHQAYLENLCKRPNIKKICEIGGGANPSLPLEFIHKHNLEYTLLDISKDELAKAPAGYQKIVADITQPNLHLGQHWDLVFSKMLAEHVVDGESFHKNVFNLLNSNGIAFHFFPTLFSSPFIINKFLPEKNSKALLAQFCKGRDSAGKYGKFPAYYSWCFGPTKKQLKKFENLGYAIDNYIGFFGHGYYERVPFLNKLCQRFAKFLLTHPLPWLTSYAYLVLSRK